ncbi:MAG: hypothetical protein ACC656_15240, partial [Candidatus Heimdallarchaeota archaeon]
NQFPISKQGKNIRKSTIKGLSDAKGLLDIFKLDDIISYPVKVMKNGNEVAKDLKIRVLRDIDLIKELGGKVDGKGVEKVINRYEKYAKLIEKQLRNEGEDTIVLLHLGKVTRNIYHDAVASLSRRLEPMEGSGLESFQWVLKIKENGKSFDLIVKFPKKYSQMDNTLVDNGVTREAAGQKLLMMLSGDLESDFYFYGAYRNGDDQSNSAILNRIAMKSTNMQPRNTVSTFWSMRGEKQFIANQWFRAYQNDKSVTTKFFVQTKKGVKFDLDALRSFLENLKQKYDYLDEDLIDYFINLFDLSAKKNSDGSWDRSADQLQWFKKFVKSEGRVYALPAKYTTED